VVEPRLRLAAGVNHPSPMPDFPGIPELSGRPGAFRLSLFIALLFLFALFILTAVVARVEFVGV
jgi:hypothetical protein